MYEKFFHFAESPFNLTPDPRFFFSSPKHEDAFAQILYGIEARKGFIVLTGEVGTGKTTLCRLLLDRLDAKIKTSLVFNPNFTTIELLQAINQDFGIACTTQSKRELVDELNRFLLAELSQGGNAVLILDEAQNLTTDCLEEIRLLSNLETSKEKLLQILLVGQPELRDKLMLQELRQVNQRVSLRYHLDPLDPKETQNYIGYRLKVAGGQERVLFTPKAMDKIHRLTHGVPRLINILCDKALLAAYVAETTVVNEALVDRAQLELEGRSSGAVVAASMKHAVFDRSVIRLIAWGGGFLAGLLLLGGLLWWWKVPAQPVPPPPSPPEPSAQATVSTGSAPVASLSGDLGAKESAGSTPAESQPAPAEFQRDADGIFRVGDPKLAWAAAYLTLLGRWGIKPEIKKEELSGLDPEVLIQRAGFKFYTVPLDWRKLERLDYPVLIQLMSGGTDPPHEAVLAGLSAKEAVVLDPLHGKWTPRRDELERRWTGQAVLFWKELEGITLPIGKKTGSVPSIEALQRILKTEDLYSGSVDGIFGPRTRRALKFFQQKMGLKDDGVLGLESYLALAKAARPGEVPSLRPDLGMPAMKNQGEPLDPAER
jgi:general secretion pathway protein A